MTNAAVLLAGKSSFSPAAAWTEFVIAPDVRTVVSSVTVTLAFEAIVPKAHETIPEALVQFPWLDDTDAKVRLAGNASVIVTPVAGEGPALVSAIFQITLLVAIT